MSAEDINRALEEDGGDRGDDEEEEKPIAYKGFNADLTCRGFQYADGGTFTTSDPLVLCESGFHACKYPEDCFYFYNDPTSVYYKVELSPDEDGVIQDPNSCTVVTKEITLKECIGDREALLEYFATNYNKDERADDPTYQYEDEFSEDFGRMLDIDYRYIREIRSDEEIQEIIETDPSFIIKIGHRFRFIDGYTDAIWMCVEKRQKSYYNGHKTIYYTDHWFMVDPIEHNEPFDDFPIDDREMTFGSFKNTRLQEGLNDSYTKWMRKTLGRFMVLMKIDDDEDYYAHITLPSVYEVCKNDKKEKLNYMFPWFKKKNIMNKFYDDEHHGEPYFGHTAEEYNYFWLRTPDDHGMSFATGDYGGFPSYYYTPGRFRICPLLCVRLVKREDLDDPHIWEIPSYLRGDIDPSEFIHLDSE